MKHIVSVSIGSSKRDNKAEINVLGENVVIERIGTDGDINKAIHLIEELDGKVDAFGMGGIDLYIWSGKRRYIFREAKKIANAAKETPIVDGSGLKNTLERKVIQDLIKKEPEMFVDTKVLLVSAMDRFGMAETLRKANCETLCGDLIFALGLPIPIYKLELLSLVARVIAPIVVQLPFSLLYPTGSRQDTKSVSHKYERFYQWADVIAGDFHMIKKYLPSNLEGKTIITNTVTSDDVELLKEVGIKKLITTTPNINGRSFGTNVMEGLLVSLLKKPVKQITETDYLEMLKKLEFSPRIEILNRQGA